MSENVCFTGRVAWDTSIRAAVWLSENSLNCFHCKMQCPGCNLQQCKRQWSPAQWKAETPYIHGRAYCYECDPQMFGRTFSEALASLECLRMLLVNYSPACQRHFYLFMMEWKQNVVGTEAFISLKRTGALPIFSQDVMEDAGNAVYLVLMRLIAPQFLLDTYVDNVTPETVGNLVESLLGYFMLRPAQPDSWRNGFKKFLFVAIRLLRCLSPCWGTQDWCRRNVYSLADIEHCIRAKESSWAKTRLN